MKYKRLMIALLCALLTLTFVACTDTSRIPQEMINKQDAFYLETELIGEVPAIDDCSVMQGACANEKYLWAIMITTKDYHDCSKGEGFIMKFDLNTMEEVSRSQRLPLGHANDMTWNPETNEIYVNEGYDNRIAIVDADTLQIKEVFRTVSYSHAIAYEPVSKQYVLAFESSDDQKMCFWVTDAQFEKLYGRLGPKSTLISQGMFADESYLYFIFWDNSKSGDGPGNVIYVTDWEGNLITEIKVGLDPMEPENISIVGDYFYICCNSSDMENAPIYRGKLVKTEAE